MVLKGAGRGKEKRAEQLGAQSEERDIGDRIYEAWGLTGVCVGREALPGLFDSVASSILVDFIETSPAL